MKSGEEQDQRVVRDLVSHLVQNQRVVLEMTIKSLAYDVCHISGMNGLKM